MWINYLHRKYIKTINLADLLCPERKTKLSPVGEDFSSFCRTPWSLNLFSYVDVIDTRVARDARRCLFRAATMPRRQEDDDHFMGRALKTYNKESNTLVNGPNRLQF
ncbi:hypothetical protein DPMN_135913 [Dreissena polymorpha]|uniref:Uncharacterized protein n=1 Tax=Dreissena polymorpha TaxID=45954 RepID=A0A9D4G2P5_DREPO|nr:hypothetical protein DPMN_135913 [Dreissena polymorpha]